MLFNDVADSIEGRSIGGDQRNSVSLFLWFVCLKCRPVMAFGFSYLFVDSSFVVIAFKKIYFECVEVTFFLIRLGADAS